MRGLSLRTRIEDWLMNRRGLSYTQQLDRWAQIKPVGTEPTIAPIVFGAKTNAHAKFRLLRKVG